MRFKNLGELRHHLSKLEKKPSPASLKEVDLLFHKFQTEFYSTNNQEDKRKYASFMKECDGSKMIIALKLTQMKKPKSKSRKSQKPKKKSGSGFFGLFKKKKTSGQKKGKSRPKPKVYQ